MGYVAVEFLAWMLVYNTECYLGEEEASKEDNNKVDWEGGRFDNSLEGLYTTYNS